MADYRNLVPFIKKWEGGLSKDTRDQCSKDPLPDGSGYHTNKGICWMTFKSVFGSGSDSVKRFYAMNDEDWGKVYKPLFWDKMGGDGIKSQRIADALVNWAWGSGTSTPSKAIQRIVGVNPDGVIGNQTINAINAGNEEDIYQKLKKANIDFFDNLSQSPKYSMYRAGWFNRLNNLYDDYMKSVKKFVGKGIATTKRHPILTGVLVVALIGASYILYKTLKTKNK